MDGRFSESQRSKRNARNEEDDKWECTVCTYINPIESYKCEMCYMRKGTSTRKPRLNPQVVEQQQLIAQAILKEKDEDHRRRKEMKPNSLKMGSGSSVKLNNVDRSSSLLFKVFANGFSVVITEFQWKPPLKPTNSMDSPVTSNCSSLQSLAGVFSTNSEQLSPTDSTHASSDRNGNMETFTEYELTDSTDVKVLRTNVPKLAAGVGPSVFDAVPHSLSSASSSIGYNAPSCSSSTPNSLHPSPVHVKPELQKDAADAEPAMKACDSDDASTSDESTVVKDSLDLPGDSKQIRTNVSLRQLRPVRSASGGLSADVNVPESHSPKRRRSLRENTVTESSGVRSGFSAKSLCNPNVFPTAPDLVNKRKRGKGQRPLAASQPPHSQRQTSPHASPSLAPPSSTWTSNSENRDSNGISLRISVNSRSGVKAPRLDPNRCDDSQRLETLPDRDPSSQVRKRRYTGAQRAGLKCKIRVLHTSSPEEPDSRVVTYSTSPSVSLLEQKESDDGSEPCVSPVTGGGETFSGTLQQRLSTESKSTSAMTDSSGANALEMSH